ncbi:13657_t:CDS:2 [Cetraspora pellucida]|uniref:13657_t:CDS:1 n=1 Tax=Cetraspora pellucida TaxID=1433469 RepID=A0A9N9N9Y7_9GLOM|nr:13657_t:CDS:2 [Cetraspora pellucida]
MSCLKAGLLKTLSKDLCLLLEEAIEYNVLITAGTGDNTKTFKAHTVILRSRSAYFRNALSDTWAKKESDHIVFTKPNISPEAFEVILGYIYGATINLPAIDMLVILEILIATDELCLTELADYIIEHLFNNKQWMRENFILIYQTAFLKGSFKNLQLFCIDIIEKTPDIIFKAKDFTDTDPKLLTILLGQSNLLTPEIEVWDALLKWGMSNTSPPLDPNYKIWTQESFQNLQEILQQFIPFINFTVISSSDFYYKIIPFQLILPSDLYDDLLKFHLAPQINPTHQFLRSPKRNQPFQSIFINNNHAAWIMSQIDYNQPAITYNGNNPKLLPYDLKLLTSSSFIFSLNKTNVGQSIVSRVVNYSKAIRNSHGPSFGNDDLWVKVTCVRNLPLPSFCRPRSYERRIFDLEQFHVEDYEVFQVIKKTNVIYL